MPAPPLLTAVPHHEHRSAAALRTLVAVHGDPAAPPAVTELVADEAALLIEAVFEAAAADSDLPVLAVREAVENLVHAGFADAVVSVLDRGRTLRLADHGPGVEDVTLALTPGFSTAGAAERAVIRGVGSGLPLAARAMSDAGGELRSSRTSAVAWSSRSPARRGTLAGRTSARPRASRARRPSWRCCWSSAPPALSRSPTSSSVPSPPAVARSPSSSSEGS